MNTCGCINKHYIIMYVVSTAFLNLMFTCSILSFVSLALTQVLALHEDSNKLLLSQCMHGLTLGILLV